MVSNTDKPIRIAQIIGKLSAGGVEMAVFNYYRAIDKEKIQFDFYYDADSTIEPPQDLIDMGARFYKIPPYQKLSSYLKSLKKYFNENNYEIVHSHMNTLSVFPLYAAWCSNIPVRIAHNHSVPSGKEIKRDSLKYFLRLFSKVFATDCFACSEKAGRWLFGNKEYNKGKVLVVKNAVDFDRFHPPKEITKKIKDKYCINDKFVVGHVGRFTSAKNHKFLLDVFEQVKKKRSNSVLMLVGGGELDEYIHRIIREKNLVDSVVFIGQVNNPELYYGVADVIAMPSLFEGLSLTTIESQIAGTPVVVSKAIPEEAIISDGCTRLDLDIETWVNVILNSKGTIVNLDSRSDDYSISKASKLLENKYFDLINYKNNIKSQ